MGQALKITLFTALLLLGASTSAQTRIAAIDALDGGQIGEELSSSPSIDIVQGSCGTSEEGFYDTLLRIKVANTSDTALSFKRVRFVIPDPYGSGGKLTTKRFALVGSSEVPPSDTEFTYLYVLFLDKSGAAKQYAGETENIPTNLGFRTVRVLLSGRDQLGRSISLSARTTLSFDNFDRCSN